MRILVHDYSGHPFQVQLSRALARRAHEVLHVYCSSYQTGKGAMSHLAGDPGTLQIEAIDLGETFDRYSPARRLRQELAYGATFAARAAANRPDVILSSNDPLFAKARAAGWCRQSRTPWVFWLQDIYSVAMASYARSRLGPLAPVLGSAFKGLERNLLRQAAAVVAITEDFRPMLYRWRVPDERCHVIENWAPLDELTPQPKDNEWSRAHGLSDRPVLMYSGTLGLKHNPGVLLALAERLRSVGDARVAVVSEGKGAEWLSREVARRDLANVVLLPFQPYELLPQVLATADVLVALLDRDAGVFSVPSKILTYLCAGRPIVAAMPQVNLAARTLQRAGAGIVVPPDDTSAFVAAVLHLLADDDARRRHGQQARSYAEKTFDIDRIVARFEPILAAVAERRSNPFSVGSHELC